jgi:hypothetical protein
MKVDLLLALKNKRGYFISEYLKYHGPTDAEAGKTLVYKARDYGYSERTKDVFGTTLRDWAKNNNAPLWAVKTASLFILDLGYRPDKIELVAIASLLLPDISHTDFLKQFDQIKDKDIQEAIKELKQQT